MLTRLTVDAAVVSSYVLDKLLRKQTVSFRAWFLSEHELQKSGLVV